jgi:surfeit locus 1 family protein
MKLLKAIFAIVIVGLGAAIMISLGFWQLDRLEERKAHNAQIESQIHQPPLPITGEILDPTGLEYRPVTVTGTYDYSQEIILRNRTLNDALFSKREPYQNVSGRVTVTGLLRLSQSKTAPIGPSDPFVNADMPRLDAWYWVNIPQIQQQFREYELLPFYIEQDPGPDETAIPAPTHEIDMSEGSHLSYAIQWFSFAIILVVGSIGLWWSRRGKPNKKAQG